MSSSQQLLLGEGAGGAAPVFIEEVFSTYLYTGTGATRTITNNIDLSTKGGLVWIKNRDTAGYSNQLIDTVRGAPNSLVSNLADPQTSATYGLTAFTTSGFTLGTAVASDIEYNALNKTFVSWTFRKQPKFFDIVTYTGDSTSPRQISHNLGSTPGCVMIKKTSGSAAAWQVWNRGVSSPAGAFGVLNSTIDFGVNSDAFYFSNPTSTYVTVGTAGTVNLSNETYVMYLFAHDAGGFGLTGTDNVISCGSVSATGSTLAEVNLGWEPQWLLIKGSNITNGWSIIDNMRGFTADNGVSWLQPNTSAAEVASPTTPSVYLTSTGFKVNSNESPLNGTGTYIYVAIRRGPMKVPTDGTKVFSPIISSASAGTVLTTNFPIDLQIQSFRSTTGAHRVMDRLRGVSTNATAVGTGLATTNTNAETSSIGTFSLGWDNTSFKMTTSFETTSGVFWNFQRAPSFFDEVCYTGTGVAGLTVAHNLTVVPEWMIVKGRSIAEEWNVYFGNNTNYLKLNSNDVPQTATTRWNDTSPTSSVFSLGTSGWVNQSGSTYVAYLFATCAGVSKVGSYTGNGTTQTIDCGFGAGGARFVLIKRTDASGDWYTYDTARGMTVLTDPYLWLNSTAAEVATLGSVTTVSTGFALDSTILAAINVNTGTYIFLAIA